MGKQIQFYMDKETESAFAEYILQESQLLHEDDDANLTAVKDPQEFSDHGDWGVLYISKPEFGELIIRGLPNGVRYLDVMKSPVIEFTLSGVDDTKKELRRGRLWVEMKYWDDEGNLIEKPEELDNWYKRLSGWIRKRLPRTEYRLWGCSYKDYMSPSIKDLLDKGYKI